LEGANRGAELSIERHRECASRILKIAFGRATGLLVVKQDEEGG